jgi:GNAT superfamily N-acetyltransferase
LVALRRLSAGRCREIISDVTCGPPAADVVASALASTWGLMATTLQNGWARNVGRAAALVTNVPLPTLNGVWVTDEKTPPEDIEAALEAVAASGVAHCVQLRPGCDPVAMSVAERRGLHRVPAIPMMAAEGPVDGPEPDALVIRRVAPTETSLHCAIAASAFELAPDALAGFITPAVLGLPEVRCYVGEVAGEPVVTALSITLADAVGIFNVATPPAHRRRGYGSAVTARAYNDGLQAGASWGWLQSSDVGYGVYEALGFTTLERWPCWVTTS